MTKRNQILRLQRVDATPFVFSGRLIAEAEEHWSERTQLVCRLALYRTEEGRYVTERRRYTDQALLLLPYDPRLSAIDEFDSLESAIACFHSGPLVDEEPLNLRFTEMLAAVRRGLPDRSMGYEDWAREISTLLSQGRVDEAVIAVDRACEQHGDTIGSLTRAKSLARFFASAYRRLGESVRSKPTLEEALLDGPKPYPGGLEALYLLARLKFELRDTSGSIRLLEQRPKLERNLERSQLERVIQHWTLLLQCYTQIDEHDAAWKVYAELDRDAPVEFRVQFERFKPKR